MRFRLYGQAIYALTPNPTGIKTQKNRLPSRIGGDCGVLRLCIVVAFGRLLSRRVAEQIVKTVDAQADAINGGHDLTGLFVHALLCRVCLGNVRAVRRQIALCGASYGHSRGTLR